MNGVYRLKLIGQKVIKVMFLFSIFKVNYNNWMVISYLQCSNISAIFMTIKYYIMNYSEDRKWQTDCTWFCYCFDRYYFILEDFYRWNMIMYKYGLYLFFRFLCSTSHGYESTSLVCWLGRYRHLFGWICYQS